MSLTIIAAISSNGVIGNNETDEKGLEKYTMPWPWIKGDMLHFMELTKGHNVITGRKTAESIKRFPLKGRRNIVLSRNKRPFYRGVHEGVKIINSLEEASRIDSQYDLGFNDKVVYRVGSIDDALKFCSGKETYISGGSEIYKQFLPLSGRMEITWIHDVFEGNVLFPNVNWENWSEIKRKFHTDEKTEINYSFTTYTRRRTA